MFKIFKIKFVHVINSIFFVLIHLVIELYSTNLDILDNNRSVNVDYSMGTPSGKSHCTGVGDLLAHSHEHLD